MITESTIYWITRMDYLQTGAFVMSGVLAGLALAGLITSLFCCAVNATNMSGGYTSGKALMPYSKKGVKISIKVLLPALLLLLSAFFIPNTKEICAMKIIPKIVNNEEVQELPNKIVEFANDWIEELKPNKTGDE